MTASEGPDNRPGAADISTWLGHDEGLSERESQVVQLCADGLSNREIAEALFLNVETVRSHLKNIYQRLGLRNRAQAAAWVSENRRAAELTTPRGWRTERPTGYKVADQAGADRPAVVDPADVRRRLSLLGLGGDQRSLLSPYVDDVRFLADELAERQIARWTQPAETARLLTREHTVSNLIQESREYLVGLFANSYDEDHVARMVGVGAAYHRMHLPPQWYVASCCHIVCDGLSIIANSPAGDTSELIESAVALLGSVLFDAALVLDGYEVALTSELSDGKSPEPAPRRAPVASETGQRPAARPRPLVQVQPGQDDTMARRRYLGLDSEAVETIHGAAPVVEATVPSMLDEFYQLISGDEVLSGLVPAETVDRLLHSVGRYWQEVVTSRFDEAYAASRLRVGIVHERIGVRPQLYLAGVALQLSGLIRKIADDGPHDQTIDALIRSVFFDLTFVIDAYMEARVSTLLEISRFAGQVVTGLANGVAVVDRRHRIEYANEELLAIVGVSPEVLHRLPLRSALPFDGIDDLVMSARADAQGRRATLYEFGDRQFRITAIRLEHSVTGRDGLVALVLDDVSEVLQLGTALAHEQDRLDHILSSVQVLAWEMDRHDLTMLAVSASSSELLGLRDVDAIGRPLLVDMIHEGDRERFSLACRELELGDHDQLDHRIQTDGDVIWVRTALAATRAPSGAETVFGVTVPLATPSDVGSPSSGRLRGLLTDLSRASRRAHEEAEEEDRLEGEWFTIDAVEPGRWFLDGLVEPLLVPSYLSEFARVGWRFQGDLVRVGECWHLVVVDRVVGEP